MTPAVHAAAKAGIPYRIHKYRHDPRSQRYGEEAAQALGLPAQQVYKTLITQTTDGTIAVAIISVAERLDLKALAEALGAKRAELAAGAAAQRATGYVIGGISPLGHKRRLPCVIDDRVRELDAVFVSAGRRGLEIELCPSDLIALTGALLTPIRASLRSPVPATGLAILNSV